jgi:hypothetical protein
MSSSEHEIKSPVGCLRFLTLLATKSKSCNQEKNYQTFYISNMFPTLEHVFSVLSFSKWLLKAYKNSPLSTFFIQKSSTVVDITFILN